MLIAALISYVRFFFVFSLAGCEDGIYLVYNNLKDFAEGEGERNIKARGYGWKNW